MSEVVALTACHFVSSGVCKYFRLARKVHNKNTGDKLIMNFPHNKLTKYKVTLESVRLLLANNQTH